jgi:tRNA(His) guanylyltransferase
LVITVPRLSHRYHFEKPNDARGLSLMNAAAVEVMRELTDIVIAYGVSDEFRCVANSALWRFSEALI